MEKVQKASNPGRYYTARDVKISERGDTGRRRHI
jgi:hypothetical protein